MERKARLQAKGVPKVLECLCGWLQTRLGRVSLNEVLAASEKERRLRQELRRRRRRGPRLGRILDFRVASQLTDGVEGVGKMSGQYTIKKIIIIK